MTRPVSANPLRPQVEGVPTPEQEDAMMLADLNDWHAKFHRVAPCAECGWVFPHAHIPHEGA